MGKFSADLAKATGVKLPTEDTKKSTSKMKALAAPAAVTAAVDEFLTVEQEMANLTARKETACETIRTFAFEHYFDTKTMENFVLDGQVGSVNVNVKEQYSLKDPEALQTWLKAHKANPEDYIKEETTVGIDYDALTDKERKALMAFITKEFGARAGVLIKEQTKYKVEGLKEKMPSLSKTLEEMQELRQAAGHHAPTVASRRTKG
jgi:hypothetical protein